jgi:hypothetical protein
LALAHWFFPIRWIAPQFGAHFDRCNYSTYLLNVKIRQRQDCLSKQLGDALLLFKRLRAGFSFPQALEMPPYPSGSCWNGIQNSYP